MSEIRITSDGRGVGTRVYVNGQELTGVMALSFTATANENVVVHLTMIPDDIDFGDEAHIRLTYSDPVTGETFTRDTTPLVVEQADTPITFAYNVCPDHQHEWSGWSAPVLEADVNVRERRCLRPGCDLHERRWGGGSGAEGERVG